jgi:hypothetical protein
MTTRYRPIRGARARRRSAPQFKLQGIVLRDEGSVGTIEERHIVLQTPRGTTEMRLEDPRPVKPAAAPACNGRPPILPSPQPWRGRPV